MTLYDLRDYLFPPNGKPLLLSSGENCVCVQCPDGWIEQRKNALVEEGYCSETAVGRGADTSDLWRSGNSYTGTFYIQYTKLPDGSLRYGADWAARHMSVGQVYHRVCTVIIYDYHGNQLKRDDDIHSDLVLVAHHDRKVFPSGVAVDDVLEFQWGGEERYFYSKGYGLVGWENLANKTGNYVISFSAAPQTPVPHAVARPPFQEQPPVPDYPPGTQPQSVLVNNNGVRLRPAPSLSNKEIRYLIKGEQVTRYGAPVVQADGYSWYRVTDGMGTSGWSADPISGVPSFTAVTVPSAFRLKNPLPGGIITARFNEPRDYGRHEGMDWALAPNPCAIGMVEALASADGVVDSVRDFPTAKALNKLLTGYGLYVRIKHVVGSDTWYTWTCHLSASLVCVGQQVKQGEPVGILGTSGNSTGYHVHLTVQHIGKGLSGYVIEDVVDPEPLLA